VGIEQHPERCREARRKFRRYSSIEIREADFLVDSKEKFDYIVGNPPYVSILHLNEDEKAEYRTRYKTAAGRFDLYMLFFEQALRQLDDGGRLVFITPEKYLYVNTAQSLRLLLAGRRVKELSFVREDAFPGFVTYPLVTVVDNKNPGEITRVRMRDGSSRQVVPPAGQYSWMAGLSGTDSIRSDHTLADIADRVSCGIATGADSVYVHRADELPAELSRFAFPTIAGRQLGVDAVPLPTDVMLIPYSRKGKLLDEDSLGPLRKYLRRPAMFKQLSDRTCFDRKQWYSFHDNAPLPDILRPKLLCKDIAGEPRFWIDREGSIVPRHSVYYIVPKSAEILDDLAEYLNSAEVGAWLKRESQRAANGFLRLQSSVLKRVPVPARLAAGKVLASC
jgi:hypothetical protein